MKKLFVILFACISFVWAEHDKYDFACSERQFDKAGFYDDNKYELFQPANGDYVMMVDKGSVQQKDKLVIFWFTTIYVKGKQPTEKVYNSRKYKPIGYDKTKVVVNPRDRTSKFLAIQNYDCSGRPLESPTESSLSRSEEWISIVPSSAMEAMALFILK